MGRTILEHESDGQFALLSRLRGLDSAERVRAHVRVIGGTETSQIVAPQNVEDLSNQFDLSGFAKSNRLAGPQIEPGEQTAVDLARFALLHHCRMHTIVDGMAVLRHIGLSCVLAGIAVLLLPAETRQARKQILAEVIAASGLTAPREAAGEQGRPITSYAVLDDRSVYVLAYYWDLPSGTLEDPLRILSHDRGSGEWKAGQLALAGDRIAHSECGGSVLSVHALPDAFLLETHINPSAGCLLVVSRNLQFRAALYGWYLAAFGDGLTVFQRSEVHFASVHPAELAVYNARTGQEMPLFPRKPFQAIRSAYGAKLAEFYRTHEDWCMRNNHPCDPESMDSSVVGEVATSAQEHALAFVISYDAIQEFPGDLKTPPGPGKVVYLYRHVDNQATLEYRELLLSDIEARFGNLPLRSLLEPEKLQQIFAK